MDIRTGTALPTPALTSGARPAGAASPAPTAVTDAAQRPSLRQGPLLATNEDRALYHAALGVDVTLPRPLPPEVTLVEVVRRQDRANGPLTPALIERVHDAATAGARDVATEKRFTAFTRSAMSHLADRGYELTERQRGIAASGPVDRFA